MSDPWVSYIPTEEGNLVVVCAPEADKADLDLLETELDAQFGPRGVFILTTNMEVDLHQVRPPAPGEILWVSIGDASQAEVDLVTAELQEYLDAVKPKGERGAFMVSNFTPVITEMTHQELLVLRAQVDMMLEHTADRQPTAVVTPPVG